MISFIYFDLGGVVVDDLTGTGKWQQFTDSIGVQPEDRPKVRELWSRYREELCTTRDVHTLIPMLNEELGLELADDYPLQQVLLDLFYANPDIWPVLKSAQQKVPIGLLTNMYPGMYKSIVRKNILPDIEWKAIVDSSIEGFAKPDPRLFQIAEERAGVAKANILFVDNEPINVEAARAFGWQAVAYDSSNHERAANDLDQFLLTELKT